MRVSVGFGREIVGSRGPRTEPGGLGVSGPGGGQVGGIGRFWARNRGVGGPKIKARRLGGVGARWRPGGGYRSILGEKSWGRGSQEQSPEAWGLGEEMPWRGGRRGGARGEEYRGFWAELAGYSCKNRGCMSGGCRGEDEGPEEVRGKGKCWSLSLSRTRLWGRRIVGPPLCALALSPRRRPHFL